MCLVSSVAPPGAKAEIHSIIDDLHSASSVTRNDCHGTRPSPCGCTRWNARWGGETKLSELEARRDSFGALPPRLARTSASRTKLMQLIRVESSCLRREPVVSAASRQSVRTPPNELGDQTLPRAAVLSTQQNDAPVALARAIELHQHVFIQFGLFDELNFAAVKVREITNFDDVVSKPVTVHRNLGVDKRLAHVADARLGAALMMD